MAHSVRRSAGRKCEKNRTPEMASGFCNFTGSLLSVSERDRRSGKRFSSDRVFCNGTSAAGEAEASPRASAAGEEGASPRASAAGVEGASPHASAEEEEGVLPPGERVFSLVYAGERASPCGERVFLRVSAAGAVQRRRRLRYRR